VIQRVFLKLSYCFGNQLAAKWQGTSLEDVYDAWANDTDLGNLTLAAINCGMDIAKRQSYPPNQSEFISFCRQYNPARTALKIKSKLSPEQIESNRKRIAGIAEMLSRNKRA
jgi:hypothetical protein